MSTTPPDREEDREAMAEAHWEQQLTNAYAEGRKDEREECMSPKAPALLTDERIEDLWEKYVGWPTPRIPLLPKDVRSFAKVIEAEVRTLAAAPGEFERGWLQGREQEKALWELTAAGQAIEALNSVAELRSALSGLFNNSGRADWPDDLYDAAEQALKNSARAADAAIR